MADIDLIPPDYRDWLAKHWMLRTSLIGFAAINVLILLAGVWLHYSTARAEEAAAQLQSKNAITQQQQTELQQLIDQQSEYERRLSLLHGLRTGAAIDDIFAIIDRSLIVGDLWFEDWSFRRAGVIVNGEQRGIETGYFIIVSDDGTPAADQELEVETHMTIQGQARDHQALSRFVRALFEQQDIKDVNVQKTSQSNYAGRRVVDFAVTAVLNSAFDGP